MNLVWAAVGAAAGVPAGGVLRGPVFQLSVPAGVPDRATCPRCVAPVGRGPVCGHCGASLGPPAVLELVTAGVLGLLVGTSGGQPDIFALCFLGGLGVALATIDLAVQRLPDRLTLPAYPILIALLSAAAVMSHDLVPLLRALEGGTVLAACYLGLALIRPGGLGGGDVKLGGLIGLILGWLGWSAVVAGTVLGFLLSAVVSLVLLAAHRITLRDAIPFGPFLLGGALLAVLMSAQ